MASGSEFTTETRRHWQPLTRAFRCSDYPSYQSQCQAIGMQTGVCDSNGQNCLAGCTEDSWGNPQCWIGCQSGYTTNYNNLNQVCQSNYPSDVNNCGTSGNSCIKNAGSGYLSGSAKCNNGICSVSCKTGFTSQNNVCVANALTCQNGAVPDGNGNCVRSECHIRNCIAPQCRLTLSTFRV